MVFNDRESSENVCFGADETLAEVRKQGLDCDKEVKSDAGVLWKNWGKIVKINFWLFMP